MITTNTLPETLYSAGQVREIDRMAIEEHGFDGFDLMSKAAKFSFHILVKHAKEFNHIQVLCGSGNNAGDGYLLAAIASKRNISVEVFYLSEPYKLKGDAQKAYQHCITEGVPVHTYFHGALTHSTPNECVIVDALLGTGLNTEVKDLYREAINEINESSSPTLAIDIPSGLSADTGQALGTAVKASWTASFIALKLGLFTASGPVHAGEIFFDRLDIPIEIIEQQTAIATCLQLKTLLNAIPDRTKDSHKGQNGHTLIIGGDHGYGGAALMAAEATVRMGAGTVTLISHQEHCTASLTRCPEVMFKAINSAQQLKDLLPTADVIVIGPGLGQSAWSQSMLLTVLQHSGEKQTPTIFDADALNLLSQHADWIPKNQATGDHYIFTPHPGEAGRLLKQTTVEIQKNRFESIKQLQKEWQGHFLLKGSGSLLCHPDNTIQLCTYGNPGMASGGMGDVLSGIIGGLVSQGFNLKLSLALAVCLHAKAADLAAEKNGQRGLLASDLIAYARALLNRKLL